MSENNDYETLERAWNVAQNRINEKDATIKELQESNEGIKQTNIEAYDKVKQLQEENQRLREALKALLPMAEDALKHSYDGTAHEEFLKEDREDIQNARKLIEP